MALPGIFGTIVSYAGYLMGILSLFHVLRIVNLTRQGMNMMREDPEGFERAKREYEEASRKLDE